MKYTKDWPTPKLSKAQQVLHRLMSAGENGVLSFDLQGVGGFRYSARVKDLRNEGYNIISIPEKTKNGVIGCRYFIKN